MLELVYAIDNSEGFSFCSWIVPVGGGQLPTWVVYRSIPIRHCKLHKCAPNCYIRGVHEDVKRPCLVLRFYPSEWCPMYCTCKGVAKSARCRSMRLCQWSWPKNRPNPFTFFGMGDLMIASIFPRSMLMPSLLTMCPSKGQLVILNANLDGFKRNHVVRHRSKHSRRWCKWSLRIP